MNDETAKALTAALDRHTKALESLTFQLETGDLAFNVGQILENIERAFPS